LPATSALPSHWSATDHPSSSSPTRRSSDLPVSLNGRTLYAFPDAAALARARISTLRRMQLSGRKAEYIVGIARAIAQGGVDLGADRKSTRLNSSHGSISYAVFCLKKTTSTQ